MSNKKLSDSLQIRNLIVKNRICLPPMVCSCKNESIDGYSSDLNLEHYRSFARGGVGLIIQEATCVNANGKLSPTQLGLWDDQHIEGLKKITDAVHQENCRIFVQLHHAGAISVADATFGPSSYAFTDRNGEPKTAKEMTLADIHQVQRDFIAAGKRAYLAGYDGVELHGCHSYLICQFLNPNINKRIDQYGSDPIRFVNEIVNGIRHETSDGFIVGMRLGGFEPRLEDGIRHAKRLEADGIDFIDVSFGAAGAMELFKPDDFPYNPVIFAAREIKKNTSVPVFAVNQIRLPADAQDILDQTNVDVVDIGRSMLVDSNWANKALNGETPGRCIGCAKCVWSQDPDQCPGRKLKGMKDSLRH